MRDGGYSVCVERVLGHYPVQTLSINVGTRRPLGVGAGPVAVLAALPQDEVDELLRHHAAKIAKFPGLSVDRIRRDVADARMRGYAYTKGHVVKDVNAVGVAIKDAIGNPVGAVTLAAIASRFTGGRLEHVAEAVVNAVRDIEKEMPRPKTSRHPRLKAARPRARRAVVHRRR
jgi:DNA-binding IclR family transcriptional regulator